MRFSGSERHVALVVVVSLGSALGGCNASPAESDEAKTEDAIVNEEDTHRQLAEQFALGSLIVEENYVAALTADEVVQGTAVRTPCPTPPEEPTDACQWVYRYRGNAPEEPGGNVVVGGNDRVVLRVELLPSETESSYMPITILDGAALEAAWIYGLSGYPAITWESRVERNVALDWTFPKGSIRLKELCSDSEMERADGVDRERARRNQRGPHQLGSYHGYVTTVTPAGTSVVIPEEVVYLSDVGRATSLFSWYLGTMQQTDGESFTFEHGRIEHQILNGSSSMYTMIATENELGVPQDSELGRCDDSAGTYQCQTPGLDGLRARR